MENQLANDALNIMDETRLLTFDYIAYHLRRCGYEWANRPNDLPVDPPTSSISAMRAICERLSERYAELTTNDGDGISEISVSPTEELSQKFSRICDYVFQGGVSWGRIFTLYSFGGFLAVQCVREERPEQIGVVAELLVAYTQANQANWIAGKGGWESCLQYFENARKEETNFKRKTMFAGVGVALGAVALGVVLLNR